MRLSEDTRRRARDLIEQRLGLHFPGEREDELARRLLQASRAATVSDVERYVFLLGTLPEDSNEWRQLVSHLTVGETYFLRDPEFMNTLEQQILAPLIERRRGEGLLRIRLWSAGCATGEEPYSLAILLHRLLPDRANWSVTILATDVNPRALAAARRAQYRPWSLRSTPASVRSSYFVRRGESIHEVVPSIRRMVTFAPLNLAEETYPSLATNTTAMDVILCRNVVMYFTRETQRAAARRLGDALVEGGWLAVSAAEASPQLLSPLEPVNFPGAIVFRKPARNGSLVVAATRPSPADTSSPPPTRAPQTPAPAPRTASGERGSGDEPPPLERAALEAGRGDLERAHELCLEAIAADRLDADAYLLLAAIEQERGELTAAVDAVRRAIYLTPHAASAHFLLGSLFRRQGEEIKARRSMETVVSLLEDVPEDEPVPGADGLAAGRLLETAQAYLGGG